MSYDAFVYAGAVAPEALRVNIVRLTSDLDLTTVTDVVLVVYRGDGTTSHWHPSITSQTADELVVEYEFSAADVAVKDQLVVFPNLTVPGGTRRSEPVKLRVRSPR